MRCTFILLLAATTIGCARYEYDVTRPPDLARHVGTKADTVFQRDPLEYRLRTVDGRLVVRVFNPTDDTITLDGQRSSVVDPDGQSHPLRTLTMAPRSFVKVILPPMRPRIERTGPSIGIGVGGVFGSARRRHLYGARYHDDPFYDDQPRYFTLVDDNALYWDWPGESDVRVLFVFDRTGRTFEHEFVFARKKM